MTILPPEQQRSESTVTEQKFRLRNEVEIPLRDGTVLRGWLFLPMSDQAAPAVATITPYGMDNLYPHARRYAIEGFPALVVGSRRRGDSDGDFYPFLDEGRDGYDVVEWMAQQPWCDGRVGMFGGSYLGCVQWMVAAEQPPSLCTIAPAAAGSVADLHRPNGIGRTRWLRYMVGLEGHEYKAASFADEAYWAPLLRDLYRSGHSFAEFGEVAGVSGWPLRVWDDVAALPQKSPLTSTYSSDPQRIERVNVPVLTITGQFDSIVRVALNLARMHIDLLGGAVEHKILVGPWDHPGTRLPHRHVGGVDLGPESQIDLDGVLVGWWKHVFFGDPVPSILEPNVSWFALGEQRWHGSSSLDEMDGWRRPVNLLGGGVISDPTAQLLPRSDGVEGAPPATFVHDGTLADLDTYEFEAPGNWVVSDAPASEWDGIGATYDSAPLDDALLLGGRPRLKLWITTDVVDVDLIAYVSAVRPDGWAVELGHSMLRTRFREGTDRELLVEPGEPILIDFDDFNHVGWQVDAGWRLRVIVSSLRTLAFDINRHSGKPVATERSSDAKVATVVILGDQDHPMVLELPAAPDAPLQHEAALLD